MNLKCIFKNADIERDRPYSDMVIQEEQAGIYRCQHGTSREVTQDGALAGSYFH